MNIFLNGLTKEFVDYMILLCLDGASYHRSNELIVPENIELFYIPPCTPEMNPIEQIWRELRTEGFKNEYFDTLNAVTDRLCETIRPLTKNTIKSITGRK